MPTDKDLDGQSFVQRRVLWIVGTVFALSLAAYFARFHGPWSADQDTWGQFGDFLGGVVNPIVGFCTVWLLTVSLRQNQLSLRQARDELELTRQALIDAKDMQSATERALRQQVELGQMTHDMNNTISLWAGLNSKANELRDRLVNFTGVIHGSQDPRAGIQQQLNRVLKQLSELDQIKDAEINRLVARALQP